MSYVMLWYRKGPANYVGSLMDYVARGYSPALGRFVSADTIVPGAGSSQAYNRYMYVHGNPLAFIDPSGHAERCASATGAAIGDSTPAVCTATGETLKWEQTLKALLSKSQLGRELFANDPDIFESILWEGILDLLGVAASQPSDAYAGGARAWTIQLPQSVIETIKKTSTGYDLSLEVVAHEVFHVYQRRRDKSRDAVFTTLQMEREAAAFGWGVRFGAFGNQEWDGQREYLSSKERAYKKIKSTPFVFAWIRYNTAQEETTHNGNMVTAFTVDLAFSKAAVLEMWGAAGWAALPGDTPAQNGTPR